MKRNKNSTFCMKIDAIGLAFEKGFHVDFHQFTDKTQTRFSVGQ
jgi:hypothetical protein